MSAGPIADLDELIANLRSAIAAYEKLIAEYQRQLDDSLLQRVNLILDGRQHDRVCRPA